ADGHDLAALLLGEQVVLPARVHGLVVRKHGVVGIGALELADRGRALGDDERRADLQPVHAGLDADLRHRDGFLDGRIVERDLDDGRFDVHASILPVPPFLLKNKNFVAAKRLVMIPASRSGSPGTRDWGHMDQAAAKPLKWYQGLEKYCWVVLVISALGWLFDTMDQNLFNLVRKVSIEDLIYPHEEFVKLKHEDRLKK